MPVQSRTKAYKNTPFYRQMEAKFQQIDPQLAREWEELCDRADMRTYGYELPSRNPVQRSVQRIVRTIVRHPIGHLSGQYARHLSTVAARGVRHIAVAFWTVGLDTCQAISRWVSKTIADMNDPHYGLDDVDWRDIPDKYGNRWEQETFEPRQGCGKNNVKINIEIEVNQRA